ncbi:hypothetical protein G6F68_009713 [Rhizopus microsporus]|nr:hypothetical protein G6F68_009713 [Rhizopus microsporus]
MRALKVRWKPVPPAPRLDNLAEAIRAQPARARPLIEDGDVDAVCADAATHLRRSYVWPYQMHASIGPSCAVADFRDGRLTVWTGSQNPHMLRTDLDRLLKLGEGQIELIRLEAAGCYGRNCADDVCADAALLSIAVGAPVRVQLTREQEHQWEPKGTGQLMDVGAAINANGDMLAYDFAVRYPSNDAPILALLLTGAISTEPRTLEMGDRTAAPPYRYQNRRVVCHDMAPLVRASWLRGVSALPNSFAHECMIDELAHAAGADPVEYRVRHLDDARAVELIDATAQRALQHPRQAGDGEGAEHDGEHRPVAGIAQRRADGSGGIGHCSILPTRPRVFPGGLPYPCRMRKDPLERLLRGLYSAVLYLLLPITVYHLVWRGFRVREYFRRWDERYASYPQPTGQPRVWLHAVSVGEVNAAAPLVNALRQQRPDIRWVITTITPTGSERVRALWGDALDHVYLPYDVPGSVNRFLGHFRPSLALILETELWPKMLFGCRDRRVPVYILNARLSARSLRGYRLLAALIRRALRTVTCVAAQSQDDAERFVQLGAAPEQVQALGNLKYPLNARCGSPPAPMTVRSRR